MLHQDIVYGTINFLLGMVVVYMVMKGWLVKGWIGTAVVAFIIGCVGVAIYATEKKERREEVVEGSN